MKASVAIYAAQSYDAADAIIRALGAAAPSSSIATLRSETVTGLHAVSFTGVTGPIAFQTDGNLKIDKGSVQISEVKKGKIVLITSVG